MEAERVGEDDPEPLQPSVGEASPSFPLSLKITATSFLIVGILGVVEVILSALGGRVSIDLRALSLLISRGLWRLNALARWWALFCLWLNLPMLIAAAGLAGFSDLEPIEKGEALAIMAPLGCFMLWQLRVLIRSDIRRLFFDAEAKARLVRPAQRRYQFSLASLFAIMVAVGVVAARLGPLPFSWERPTAKGVSKAGINRKRSAGGNVDATQREEEDDDFGDVISPDIGYPEEDQPRWVRYHTGQGTSKPEGRVVFYSVGYREPRWGSGKKELLYVVFASATGKLKFPTSSWSRSGGSGGARLSKPDGSKVDLPEPGRHLYEFSDGKYRESNERVSMRQFVGFIRTDPDDYTIDALLEFARAHPDEE